MNLYEITGTVLELQERLEEGCIDKQTFNDTIESLDVSTKVENICYVIKNLEAQAEAYKKEKERLAERERIANNGINRLKESLLTHLTMTNKKKVNAGVFTVSKRISNSVKVFDETGIPEEYLIYQPAKIDKRGIAKALKDGVVIQGAELESKESITIR